jgi:tRNA nucleotidyltransferase (CCA-adding enzyme)
MKKYLERIPEELKILISKVREEAAREDLKAYLVGGFVRDLILGVKNLDLDIVVEGDGIKLAEILGHSLGAKVTAHKQFGTATLFINPSLKIDFVTARKESYPKPGHLPVVAPGSLKEDLYRRDFTINAMAVGLSDGKLVDHFGGEADLRNKIIRVLHDLSFIDDPTRILRAVRFEQRYDLRIEPRTLFLLKNALRRKMLERVHPHRTRDDLILILKERNVIKNIRRLDKLSGFDFISDKIKVTGKVLAFLKNIGKEIAWFNKINPVRRPLDCWLIYLMGLFENLDGREIKDICVKFGFRKGEEKRLLSCKQAKLKAVKELCSPKIKPSRIFALLEPLSYEVIIALKASRDNQVFSRNIKNFLEIYNGMRIFVCGEDLHCLGLPPGPKYQKIFGRVLNAKLNGKAANKDEEISLIKGLLKKRS